MRPDRERDLDRELRELASHAEYPPTPDLAGSVRGRLEAETGDTGSPARSGPQLWWVAAAALILLLAVPAFSLAVREMGGAAGSGASFSADPSSSTAACFSPEPILEVKPSRGAAGDRFGIRGKYFDGNSRDCDDDPARGVRVEFLQDGRTWELGRLVSDKGSRLAAKLEVPADARPGRAIVRAAYGQGPPEDPYGRTSAEARFFVTE